MEYEVTIVCSMSLTLPTECFFRLVQTLSTKDCKGLQRTANEYAEERRIYEDLCSPFVVNVCTLCFLGP